MIRLIRFLVSTLIIYLIADRAYQTGYRDAYFITTSNNILTEIQRLEHYADAVVSMHEAEEHGPPMTANDLANATLTVEEEDERIGVVNRGRKTDRIFAVLVSRPHPRRQS